MTQLTAADRLTIRVTDTGIGMTAEEKDRAFQAFTQGEHATDGASLHRFGGLGLGLAITKMLVDLHHGTIHASSEGRDCGSTFVIELPLTARKDPTLRSSHEQSRAAIPGATVPSNAGPGPEPVTPPAPTLRRILLVEDHAATRTTLQLLLRKRRYEVEVASCAVEAEELAATRVFDLVISDVGLPDRNGYELMKTLRATYPHLLGIALSGYGMEDDLNRSRAAGFSLHLVKPVTIRVLEEAIARLPGLS